MKKSSVERHLTDQQRAEADVKTVYPNAVKAEKDKLEVGHILCNSSRVPCLIVTEEMLARDELNIDFFFIVGHTHASYIYDGLV